MTTEIKRLMKKRDKIHAKKDQTYKKLKHLVQKKLRAAYWLYIEDVISPLDSTDTYKSCKRFWSFIKHSRSDITGMPPLKHNGLMVPDAVDQEKLLNDTVYSTFTSAPGNSCLPHHTCSSYPDMPDSHISVEGITRLLENLKPHKAAGPDGIRPRVLKE
jgi:hypothetical protein